MELTFVVVALLRSFEIPRYRVMQHDVGLPHSRRVQFYLSHSAVAGRIPSQTGVVPRDL